MGRRRRCRRRRCRWARDCLDLAGCRFGSSFHFGSFALPPLCSGSVVAVAAASTHRSSKQTAALQLESAPVLEVESVKASRIFIS